MVNYLAVGQLELLEAVPESVSRLLGLLHAVDQLFQHVGVGDEIDEQGLELSNLVQGNVFFVQFEAVLKWLVVALAHDLWVLAVGVAVMRTEARNELLDFISKQVEVLEDHFSFIVSKVEPILRRVQPELQGRHLLFVDIRIQEGFDAPEFILSGLLVSAVPQVAHDHVFLHFVSDGFQRLLLSPRGCCLRLGAVGEDGLYLCIDDMRHNGLPIELLLPEASDLLLQADYSAEVPLNFDLEQA